MRFIFIIATFFFSFTILAQQKAVYDSMPVRQRSFSKSSLDTYSKNRDFQYEKETIEQPSLWDRFWMWVWNIYDSIMSTEGGRAAMKIFYWALALGAIAFFIFKVMRMNRMALFEATAKTGTAYSVEDENIHAISFESAIQQALQNGNYRLAIRYLYLQSLKILTDKNLIAWLPNKTNTDYLRELNKTGIQQPFRDITNIFEYAWYGNLTVTEEDFGGMQEEFLKFQKQVL
ncbi:MAG: DUF4129 domain-containing protein [Panacibacter sp.]